MTDYFNPFSLNEKVVLITGASSGIGRATAILCSKMGAKVIITGRDIIRLKSTFDELTGKGHQMIVANLTQKESRKDLCKVISSLDGLVHCAGIGHRKLCKAITEDDVALVMNTNFNASVMLQTDLLSQKKLNKSASIVFLSSRTATIPTVANSLYSASKGALQSYAKCLALELAPREIRVNCICPAMVWTPLVLQDGVTEEELTSEQKKYPLKRYGQPEDIANLAVFLLSDAASWMTGSCIEITGGSIEV